MKLSHLLLIITVFGSIVAAVGCSGNAEDPNQDKDVVHSSKIPEDQQGNQSETPNTTAPPEGS